MGPIGLINKGSGLVRGESFFIAGNNIVCSSLPKLESGNAVDFMSWFCRL